MTMPYIIMVLSFYVYALLYTSPDMYSIIIVARAFVLRQNICTDSHVTATFHSQREYF